MRCQDVFRITERQCVPHEKKHRIYIVGILEKVLQVPILSEGDIGAQFKGFSWSANKLISNFMHS